MRKPVLFLFVMMAFVMLMGCTELQQSIADPNSTLNSSVETIAAVSNTAAAFAASPPAQSLPGGLSAIILAATTAVSGLYNVYQGVRGAVMRKATRAIVQGIEAAAPEVQNAVKPMIQKEMKSAEILVQGKAIVAKLKNG